MAISRRRAIAKQGGVTTQPPPVSVSGAYTVNDMVEDIWGPPTRTDGVTFRGAPTAAHDGGILPGFPGNFYVNWEQGAILAESVPVGKHINTWGHAYCRSAEKRFLIQFTQPEVFYLLDNLDTGSWQKQTAPNPNNTNLYKQWISPSFTFEATSTYPVVSGLTSNPTGHTLKFDGNRPKEFSFLHWAWDTWYPRKFVPTNVVAISVQCAMRIVNTTEAPSVDLSTVNCIASLSCDIYSGGANDSGGSANPAIAIPKYKRITSAWRAVGSHLMTEAQIRKNPPPSIIIPGTTINVSTAPLGTASLGNAPLGGS